MGTKLNIYNDIRNKLLNSVNSNSVFKTVELWNNQVVNEETIKARTFPCAYIGFTELLWDTYKLDPSNRSIKGRQSANAVITTYLVFENYKDPHPMFSEIEPYIQTTYEQLFGLQGTYYSKLIRSAERYNLDFDNLIIWEIDWKTMLEDCGFDKGLTDANDPVGTIDETLNTDLEIDNYDIRTGII